MGDSSSKSASNLTIPDIDSMPSSARPKAVDNLTASIGDQRIEFGFRKVEPDLRGQAILNSVAKGMIFLPEYAIRIEGHSNLAKSELRLSSEDKRRIQKLSEDRAYACARLLKAAGVQNEIMCVGLGAIKGEKKGCVRLSLVLSQKWKPAQGNINELEHLQIPATETKPELVIKACEVTDALTHTTTVDEAFVAQDTGEQIQQERSKIQQERSNAQQDSKFSDPEETENPKKLQSSALVEPLVNPQDIDMKVVEQASSETVSSKEKHGFSVVVESEDLKQKFMNDYPAAPARAQQWGNAHLPWYIECCTQSTRPKTEECPLQGLSVKQIQLLQ